MYRFLIPLFVLNFLLMSCSNAAPKSSAFQLFNESTKPILIWDGQNPDQNILTEFQMLFFEATDHKIEIREQDEKNIPIISLKIDQKQANQFIVKCENNRVKIEGSSAEILRQGIHYFFLNYVRYYPFKTIEKIEGFSIPSDLNYTQEVSFEYREPYFQQNYHADLKGFNQTNQLEETWGIWGHQLMKLVAKSPNVLAEVNGEKTNEQLCFSSIQLEKEIIQLIETQNKENSNLKKFMIMPADNNLVCQCEICIKNGNSKTNASPAVFKLINKLAKKFPEFQLFGTSYMTTELHPSFKLEKNAGVMISTMSFPKGVAYEKSSKKSKIEQYLKNWKSVTKTIYVWDYAIHFDLYLSSYPTLLVHQQNLQFLQKKGVTGVFMQGNEESYAGFEDLKYFIYAQLLLNPEVNTRSLIRFYLENQYPKSGNLLADYYIEIEERTFNSKYEMDIYGGWKQQINKYLSYRPLHDLIQALETLEVNTSDSELKDLQSLKMALNYQLLEIMRMNGIGKDGYANLNSEGQIVILPEIAETLNKIEKIKQENKLEIINESHASLSQYIGLWKSQVLQKEISSPILNVNLSVISELDEDYTDLEILNNGKVGFYDYDNNWLITSLAPLSLNINSKSLLGAEKFSFSFLQDTKHRIYFPERVQLIIGKETYTVDLPNNILNQPVLKHTIEILLKKFKATDSITLHVIKQPDFKDKSNACGELQFSKK